MFNLDNVLPYTQGQVIFQKFIKKFKEIFLWKTFYFPKTRQTQKIFPELVIFQRLFGFRKILSKAKEMLENQVNIFLEIIFQQTKGALG